MVTRALAGRLRPAGDEHLGMFHEDAVFEFPYLPGGPVHVEGKAEMYLGSVQGGTDFQEFVLDACRSMDGDVIVMEYRCHARDVRSGQPYPQRYIGVLRLKDGRLSMLREYLNPLLNLSLADATTA